MFDYLEDSKAIWITPGGSLEEGESFEDALKRELFEELGVQMKEKCPEVYYRNPVYTLKNGEKVQSVEKFFLVMLEDEEFSSEHWTESEKKRMLAGNWWSAEEIKRSEEEFFSKDVLRILYELSSGNYSDVPLEIA
jgi:ADP-ribose pyrophosphatase YjhB (NUDIX family)